MASDEKRMIGQTILMTEDEAFDLQRAATVRRQHVAQFVTEAIRNAITQARAEDSERLEIANRRQYARGVDDGQAEAWGSAIKTLEESGHTDAMNILLKHPPNTGKKSEKSEVVNAAEAPWVGRGDGGTRFG